MTTRLEYLQAVRDELKAYDPGEWPNDLPGLVRDKLKTELVARLKLDEKSIEVYDEITYAKLGAYELVFDIVRTMLGSDKDECDSVDHIESNMDLHAEEPAELLTLEVILGPARTLRVIDYAIDFMAKRNHLIRELPDKIEIP